MDSREGKKYDASKPRLELISAIATFKKARVYGAGAEKYGVDNWRKGLAWSRVVGACLRHIFAWMMGEEHDKETGISHLAHAACCLDFLLEYEDTHRQMDDRFKPFPVGTTVTAEFKPGVATCKGCGHRLNCIEHIDHMKRIAQNG